jgi:bifunctional pyridoxal-dependent enzyme with beta-cystathionase and maltose regulon repressor activities
MTHRGLSFIPLLLLLYCVIRRCISTLLLQNEVIPIPVQPTDTQTYIPTAQEMEEAVLAAESKGIHPRMLLVTNPGNPLGTLYPEATLKVMIKIGNLLPKIYPISCS